MILVGDEAQHGASDEDRSLSSADVRRPRRLSGMALENPEQHRAAGI